MPWLVRLEGWSNVLASTTVQYFSDQGFRTKPGDALPVAYWDRRIIQPPGLSEEVFNNVSLTGGGQASYGTLLLANEDGVLDTMVSICWDGHNIDVYYTAVEKPVFSDFSIVIKGVVRSLTVGDEVEIEVADRRDITETPYQSVRFAGTGGAEGGVDFKDVRRPRALGICLQVEPVLINEVYNIYSFTDGGGGSPPGLISVRDRGVYLYGGNNFDTYEQLSSSTMTGVDYSISASLGLMRLAVPADGPVTIDLAGRIFDASLLQNGDFDDGLTGWTTVGSSITTSSGFVFKPTTSASASIHQTITAEVGRWYVITGTILASTGTANLKMDDTSVLQITPNRGFAYPFQATSVSTKVEISMNPDFGGRLEVFRFNKFTSRAGDMLEWIAKRYIGVASSDIEYTDISTLNAAQNAALQYYTPAGDNRSAAEAMTDIANSVGAYWWFDNVTGKFRVRRFETPSSTADATVVARDIFSIRARPTELRVRTQTVNWGRRWRPLSDDEVAGGVSDVTKQSLKVNSYPAIYTYASTTIEAKTWRDEDFDSLFVYEAPAIAEAQRRAELFGPQRYSYDIELYGDNVDIQPGNTVRITYPRFGLSNGKNFRIVKTQRDPISRAVTFTVWG
jgi:hypothetical protein